MQYCLNYLLFRIQLCIYLWLNFVLDSRPRAHHSAICCSHLHHLAFPFLHLQHSTRPPFYHPPLLMACLLQGCHLLLAPVIARRHLFARLPLIRPSKSYYQKIMLLLGLSSSIIMPPSLIFGPVLTLFFLLPLRNFVGPICFSSWLPWICCGQNHSYHNFLYLPKFQILNGHPYEIVGLLEAHQLHVNLDCYPLVFHLQNQARLTLPWNDLHLC